MLNNRENQQDKAIDLLNDIINKTGQEKIQTFYSQKLTLFSLLYLAQIFIFSSQFDKSIDSITKSFSIYPPLNHNENFVVFVCKMLISLISCTANAKKCLIGLIESISNELSRSNAKDLSILFFLANTGVALGREGYTIASKIYYSLMETVIIFALMEFSRTKGQNWDIFILNVHCKETMMKSLKRI
jgi:hypothetical protein